jgi:hypothetical protein
MAEYASPHVYKAQELTETAVIFQQRVIEFPAENQRQLSIKRDAAYGTSLFNVLTRKYIKN